MKKLQWLKTKVGLFSDPRILYLLNLPNGDSYIVLWFFLKDMAGTVIWRVQSTRTAESVFQHKKP